MRLSDENTREGRHLTPEERIALQAEEIKQLRQENERLRAQLDEWKYEVKCHMDEVIAREKRKQEREVKDNEAITRLAEYEGSGLSPEEVQELAKAKADGRLKILPAKPGDTIYRPEALQYCWVIANVVIYEDEIVFIDDSDNIFRPDDIGKTVFLTREEAEKALEVVE